MAAREQKVALTIDVEEYVKGMEEATKATENLRKAFEALGAAQATFHQTFNISSLTGDTKSWTKIR